MENINYGFFNIDDNVVNGVCNWFFFNNRDNVFIVFVMKGV